MIGPLGVLGAERDLQLLGAGLPHSGYAERLVYCDLECLEYRRLLFDLHMTFKLLRGLVDADYRQFFQLIPVPFELRGGVCKLRADSSFVTDARKYFFANRVVNIWNALSKRVIGAPSLRSFKAKLIQYDCIDYDLSSFCHCFGKKSVL